MHSSAQGTRQIEQRGRTAGRPSIYPHRSVRFIGGGRSRMAAGLLVALALSALVAWFAVPLMRIHGEWADGVMRAAGLPVTGWREVPVFPGLEPGTAPELEIPTFAAVPGAARAGLIAAIVVLLALAGRYSLFRNLAYFLIFLLFVSALVNVVFDTFHLEAVVFGQIWLRQELLVWLLMPWVGVLLFVLPRENAAGGVLWLLGAQAYGFVFSVLRMVFCFGVMHYSGLLFMPVLWFALGTLGDLLALLFFYSISVYRISGHLWGTRREWQSQL